MNQAADSMLQTYDLNFPPKALAGQGFTILHIGDLHWRAHSPRKIEAQLKSILRHTPADVLVFTGDTVNRQRYWAKAAKWLKDMEGPPLRFAVPGNWDYSQGGLLDDFRETWTAAGFTVLQNEMTELQVGGQSIEVVGLGDIRVDRVDWELAGAQVPPGVFRLLLSHNPDVLLNPERLQYHLLLSGHTHGGQICFPGIGSLVTSTRIGRKYDKGVFKINDSQYVFITRGIGEGDIPLRIGSPSEVALLRIGASW